MFSLFNLFKKKPKPTYHPFSLHPKPGNKRRTFPLKRMKQGDYFTFSTGDSKTAQAVLSHINRYAAKHTQALRVTRVGGHYTIERVH